MALRRLSLRRENYLSERRFFEEERERKLQELAERGELGSGGLTPTDSLASLGTQHSGLSLYSVYSRSYLPEKLQIVKPLEGDRAGPPPLPLLVRDALWALLNHEAAGLSTLQHSFYFRHTQPRCWFEIP